MKKIFSSLVALALFMCCCGCGGHSESIEYKRVEYNNDQVLDKILVFMIPDSWIFAETFDEETGNLIVFRDEKGNSIGKVVLNTNYSGENDIFQNKEELVPVEDAKYTKISENCFMTSDKGRGSTITYQIADKMIDMYFNSAIDKSVVKQIAENMAVKDFAIKEEVEEHVSSTATSSAPSTGITVDQAPNNIDFIEEPGLINNAIPVERIYDIFNAVGCNMHLMGRPNIGKEIYFEHNYNQSTLWLYGDDGFVYMLIDNFRSNAFELAKLSEPGRGANTLNRDVLLSKPLPSDCNLLTEYNEYMLNNVSPKSLIGLADADKIIMFPFLCQHLHKNSLMPEGISVSEDGMIVSTKFYIPEVMAYLYITEDFKHMQAEYRIAAVNGDTSHLPSSMNKYNTVKVIYELTAADRFRYKEFGVIFP